MKPILRDITEEFETERLIIRSPHPGDGVAAHEAIVESAERLRVWIPWAKPEITVEEEEVLARERYLKYLARDELFFYMFLKDGNIFLGMSALHTIDWDIPRFEIGYWIRMGYEGKGYASETVKGLTQFALQLGALRIEIRTDSRNERSWRVAERAGFILDGILKNNTRDVDGILSETRIYSKVRP